MGKYWTGYTAPNTALSTELTSAASNALVLSSEFDNSVTRYKFLDAEVVLGATDLSAQTDPAFNLWVITAFDSTNYEDGSSSKEPARSPDAIIPFATTSAAQRVVTRGIVVPPEQFKLLVKNVTGVQLSTSGGHTLKYRLYSEM